MSELAGPVAPAAGCSYCGGSSVVTMGARSACQDDLPDLIAGIEPPRPEAVDLPAIPLMYVNGVPIVGLEV